MKPLRKRRGDLIATVGIGALTAALVAGTWALAPIRHSELVVEDSLQSDAKQVNALTLPNELHERWTAQAPPGWQVPLIAAGYPVAFDAQQRRLSSLDPTSGSVRWGYERDVPLCAVSTAWNAVVADYQTGRGCGDVVSINAAEGSYKATRSAHASQQVAPIASNDRVGIVSPERVELWRSDLVRTVVYGEVDIKQEPGQQPHPECTISSALTRGTLLAVAEQCENNTFVRLQTPDPEESSTPEVQASIKLKAGSQVVAINASRVAIYEPGSTAHLYVFDAQGKQVSARAIPESADIQSLQQGIYTPHNAQAGRFLQWFDGDRLYVLDAKTLDTVRVFEQAIGTGTMVGLDLVLPTREGAEQYPTRGTELFDAAKSIPIDRNGSSERVSLAFSAQTLIEQRGEQLVGLN
ncbi:Rv3212 family protein [Corynebacterium gerontici]|uniref:PQQ enzyme repeat protein n=1 Tax=Corynebacterium gerontici TaxID=2079234 RepID=A0A3G6J1P0_9CORY|nr:hypothetical protein [Corynebacterium gerontici]AZA10888.1 hypothetical protein CGERO_02820 [Corynebacterium gerontici]